MERLTITEILEDIVRINGEHKVVDRQYELLRNTCHEKQLPYFEVWFSAKDHAPRYITKDVYNLASHEGVITITDIKTNRTYDHHYEHKAVGNAS